jgi:hypothetical protein
VLVAKYCDHLPLYRQSGIYAREGVDLERSTLADWVGQCARCCARWSTAAQHVLTGEKMHADDTPVPVLAPGDGKTKTGRLWTYVRDDRPAGNEAPPAVWFAYSPNRKGEHPQTHLKSFQGDSASRCLCRLRCLVCHRVTFWKPRAGPMPAASSSRFTRHRVADCGRGAETDRCLVCH